MLYKNMPMEAPETKQTENKQNGLIQTVNPEALTDKTVWIIGDSFSAALRPYFSFFLKMFILSTKIRLMPPLTVLRIFKPILPCTSVLNVYFNTF